MNNKREKNHETLLYNITYYVIFDIFLFTSAGESDKSGPSEVRICLVLKWIVNILYNPLK